MLVACDAGRLLVRLLFGFLKTTAEITQENNMVNTVVATGI